MMNALLPLQQHHALDTTPPPQQHNTTNETNKKMDDPGRCGQRRTGRRESSTTTARSSTKINPYRINTRIHTHTHTRCCRCQVTVDCKLASAFGCLGPVSWSRVFISRLTRGSQERRARSVARRFFLSSFSAPVFLSHFVRFFLLWATPTRVFRCRAGHAILARRRAGARSIGSIQDVVTSFAPDPSEATRIHPSISWAAAAEFRPHTKSCRALISRPPKEPIH